MKWMNLVTQNISSIHLKSRYIILIRSKDGAQTKNIEPVTDPVTQASLSSDLVTGETSGTTETASESLTTHTTSPSAKTSSTSLPQSTIFTESS
jgi:hypothetical protein